MNYIDNQLIIVLYCECNNMTASLTLDIYNSQKLREEIESIGTDYKEITDEYNIEVNDVLKQYWHNCMLEITVI